MRLKGNQLATFLLVFTLGTGAQVTPAGPGLSVTGVSLESHRVAVKSSEVEQQLPLQRSPLEDFISEVANGNPNQLVGVHSPELFSMPVHQQPANNPGYVSSQTGVVTQFSMATTYGSTGLLAHNTISGFLFYYLIAGQQVILIYGDGSVQHFAVTDISSFQALSPNSPYSDFIDLAPSGSQLNASQLFNRVYSGQNQLVLQTCLANNGDPSWGRFFVTATQFEPFVKSAHPPSTSK